MFLSFLQIFLCIFLFLSRLLSMRSDLLSISPSFWQSLPWESILHDSHQALDVKVFGYGDESIMIEFRMIGMGMIWAFSLGVDASLYTPWFLQRCKKYISQQRAIFWQIEEYHPEWVVPRDTADKTYGKHFLEPWTRIIDLSISEDDILAQMHEKWRYNIRLASKRGVTTEWILPSAENIAIWMSLLSETTSRDRFSENSEEYYVSFLRILRDSNTWGMLFARLDEKVIAAGIFVYYHGVAIYYYGASTSDGEMRKHMAPYLLQWEAMKEWKLRGCKSYDLLGVAPPGAIYHSLLWVTNFKEKFGWRVLLIGTKYILTISHIQYWIFIFVRSMKKKIFQLVVRIKLLFQKD